MPSVKSRRNIVPASCALALAVSTCPALAQLRIVSMNAANTLNTDNGTPSATPRNGAQPDQHWMTEILTAIGASVSDDPTTPGSNTGIAKPIDILCLQESAGYAVTGQAYANLLDSIYPGSNYQVAHIDGAYTDPAKSTQSMIYNANAVTLISDSTVGTATTSGQPRQALKYQLRPIGYDSSADFYIYNSHYKSSTGTTNQNRRNDEAAAIRADADAMGPDKNIIYLGDFNIYRSSEPMWTTLTAAGNGQALDPVNQIGSWDNGAAFVPVHTQSPFNSATATSLGTGFSGSSGGMDDRFDFQLSTANVQDHQGFAYITNSYQAFGNNGTQHINDPINDGFNTAQPQKILDDMAGILDHLPIVADYQLPAMLSVSVGAVPPKVIKGSTDNISVAVTNAAPVSFSNGADTLAYSITPTGSVTGSASGSRLALSGPSSDSVSLTTSTVGNKSGNISVTSTSQEVADNNFSQNLGFLVVDHSDASFSPSSDSTAQSIDYGYVPQNFASRAASFTVANRPAPSGFTADLALTSINNTGSATLTTSAATFTNLAAGSSNSYTATLTTGTPGALSKTQTLNVSDESIPGATAGTPLVLTMNARVLSSATFPVSDFMSLNSSEIYNTGPFSLGAGVTLSMTGLGTMNVTGPQSNGAGSALSLHGGSVNLSTDAGSPGNFPTSVSVNSAALGISSTQHLASLSLVGSSASATLSSGANILLVTPSLVVIGAKLDLNDNKSILDYATNSPASAIRGYLLTGRAGGSWNGPGIDSTSAANNPLLTTAIGYAEASDILNISGSATASWSGQTVDATSLLLKYTYYGDLNLDGQVNADDYALIDQQVSLHGLGSTGNWINGDVNYDNVVNSADYMLMDTAFANQSGPLSPDFLAQRQAEFGPAYVSQLLSTVPEPTAITLGLLLIPLIRRRSTAPAYQSTAATAPPTPD